MTEQTFIAAKDVPPDQDDIDTLVDLPVDDWETRIAKIEAGAHPTIQVNRKSNRRKTQVVDALNDAFDLIGGAPRLAVWANTNPTEFYRLWSKMCPKDISTTVESSGEVKILHVLPPGPLDK